MTMNSVLKNAIILVLVLLSPNARALEVGSIDGADSVEVIQDGKSHELKKGTALKAGDEVRVPAKVATTLRMKDGSFLLLGQSTSVRVTESENAEHSVELNTGMVRGVFKKVQTKDAPKKLRMSIRSRAAVLGVRGTDFIVSATGEAMETHTLQGTVEVASSEAEIVAGTGTQVKAGEFVQASSQGVSAPASFDRAEFMEGLGKDQPALKFEPAAPAEEPKPEEKPTSETAAPPEAVALPVASADKKPDGPYDSAIFLFDAHYDSYSRPEPIGLSGLGVAWMPSLGITNKLRIRLSLGFTQLENSGEKDDSRKIKISSIDIKALLAVRLGRNFILEVGPTYRKWGSYGSASGGELNLAYQFNRQLLFFFDRLIIGVGMVKEPVALASPLDIFGVPLPATTGDLSPLVRVGIGFGI